MKSFVSALALILVATTAHAVELVNKDGSPISQLCIAAVESVDAFERQVDELKLSRYDLSNISCNDMPLNDFVRKFRAMDSNETISVTAFENTNNTFETALCIAAATSNEAFKQTKRNAGHLSTEEVACNGETLAKFAKQFNKSFNG
ncbi:hypothetical protein [Alteromonas sp. CYL-A6]|uniref:hypothetical protein n=1 Tax=Alteromonas nitratireducens TaxID=3390813 RepID=UPI0034B80D88